jgi:hypothetical protein
MGLLDHLNIQVGDPKKVLQANRVSVELAANAFIGE